MVVGLMRPLRSNVGHVPADGLDDIADPTADAYAPMLSMARFDLVELHLNASIPLFEPSAMLAELESLPLLGDAVLGTTLIPRTGLIPGVGTLPRTQPTPGIGTPAKQFTAGSADGAAGYDIVIDFRGSGWTAALQKPFMDAASYFTRIITDDIGGNRMIGAVYIDDLRITAELRSIDGKGGVLGAAAPDVLWSGSQLPASGSMRFDTADATVYAGRGLWDDIVFHEMMHVLGFGTLWNYGSRSLVQNGEYTGAAGLEAYRRVDADATSIPVETQGGSRTAGGHWSEQALDNELMTGFIDSANYVSEFSIMSLADLGYRVAYEPFPI
jgi:hypothetical protein